jgi:hypothetical protein
VVYLVLGQTHPGQRKYAGESYRDMLRGLVDELGLHDHVRFYNRYLSMQELLRFLQATDVYVIPYLNPLQIVSGTLAYAVACGKAVVATPFVYAREMLSNGRGMLAGFHDASSISTSVNALLGDAALKARVETQAYNHGLRMHWPAVGVAYCRLMHRVIDRHHTEVRVRRAENRRRRAVRSRQPVPVPALGVSISLPAPHPAVAGGVAGGPASPQRPSRRAKNLGTGLHPLSASAAGPDPLLSSPLS